MMQFQADLLGVPVVRPAIVETTALGAAYLAGLAVGFWKNLPEVQAHWKIDKIFEPQMSRDQAAYLRSRWNNALNRAKDWEPQEKPPAKKSPPSKPSKTSKPSPKKS
jgi:glycerol kinase